MSSHQHEPGQHGTTAHGTDDPDEFWEEFYSGDHPWSGRANSLLVDEIAARPVRAGTALDLGCGSGGDALWLASLGWQVTGADISSSALDRAAAAAEAAGIADRITWVRANLDTDFPAGSWDLITASYLHSPVALGRESVLHRALDALTPGGTLIVVSHQRGPSWRGEHPAHLPPLAEVVESVTRPGWSVVHAEVHTLPAVSPEGVEDTKEDTVVRVQREG